MQNMSFLIVDDDPDDTEMLEEALQKIDKNFVTIPLNNGNEALQWLEVTDEKPDYIFLDLNMPPLNGFQCLEKLKENEEWKYIPVIIYTTSKLHDDKERCLKLGASCFVTKPSSFDKLVETLSLVLKKDWQLL